MQRRERVEFDMEAVQVREHDSHPSHHELVILPFLDHYLTQIAL